MLDLTAPVHLTLQPVFDSKYNSARGVHVIRVFFSANDISRVGHATSPAVEAPAYAIFAMLRRSYKVAVESSQKNFSVIHLLLGHHPKHKCSDAVISSRILPLLLGRCIFS